MDRSSILTGTCWYHATWQIHFCTRSIKPLIADSKLLRSYEGVPNQFCPRVFSRCAPQVLRNGVIEWSPRWMWVHVYFMKTCACGFYVKCNFCEVGVGQILNMEAHNFRAVVKHCVKSRWEPKKYMKSWVVYGRRTALNANQLKLGLGSSDAPAPTLVENRGQVNKKCYHPQKRRRCLRHGDEVQCYCWQSSAFSCTELSVLSLP